MREWDGGRLHVNGTEAALLRQIAGNKKGS